jgi:hypothetical protein
MWLPQSNPRPDLGRLFSLCRSERAMVGADATAGKCLVQRLDGGCGYFRAVL